MVVCAKCGRQTRRDKAVFIEKPAFTNPLERKDVVDDEYTRMVTREFAYCPSCGKHLRIYEKKKRMLEAQRERQQNRQFFSRRPDNKPMYGHAVKQKQPVEEAPAQPAQEAAPAEAPTEEEGR